MCEEEGLPANLLSIIVLKIACPWPVRRAIKKSNDTQNTTL